MKVEMTYSLKWREYYLRRPDPDPVGNFECGILAQKPMDKKLCEPIAIDIANTKIELNSGEEVDW